MDVIGAGDQKMMIEPNSSDPNIESDKRMSPIRFFVVQTSAIASKGLTSTTTATKIEAGGSSPTRNPRCARPWAILTSRWATTMAVTYLADRFTPD